MKYKIMNETSKSIEKFFAEYREIQYSPKEVLIHISEEPSGVYFVREGFVKMNTILANGNELTLNIFKPISFFPMMWALNGIENNYLYQTINKVKVCKAPKREVINFLKSDPEVLFDLTKRVFSGMDGLLANISHLVFGSAENRVASALLICARRFGNRQKSGSVLLEIRLTHQDIANIAGLTRETTSIVMSKLKKEEIVLSESRKILIKDIKKLNERAEVEEIITKSINTL